MQTLDKIILLRNTIIIACLIYLATSMFNLWLGHRLRPPVSPAFLLQQEGQDGIRQANDLAFQGKHPPYKSDLTLISQRNIFGGPVTGAKQDRQEIDLANIPLAKHLDDFKLLGTIVLSSGNSKAIIEDKKKRQQDIYQEGDILGRARIKRILRNHVIVQVNGREEMLSIDIKEDKQGGRTESNYSPQGLVQNYTLSKKYVAQALQNLPTVFKQARITPYLENGRAKGFRLRHIQKNSFFKKLYLRDNDIILKVNGDILQGPQDVLTLTQEIQSRGEASLEIKRGNRIMTIHYNLR